MPVAADGPAATPRLAIGCALWRPLPRRPASATYFAGRARTSRRPKSRPSSAPVRASTGRSSMDSRFPAPGACGNGAAESRRTFRSRHPRPAPRNLGQLRPWPLFLRLTQELEPRRPSSRSRASMSSRVLIRIDARIHFLSSTASDKPPRRWTRTHAMRSEGSDARLNARPSGRPRRLNLTSSPRPPRSAPSSGFQPRRSSRPSL